MQTLDARERTFATKHAHGSWLSKAKKAPLGPRSMALAGFLYKPTPASPLLTLCFACTASYSDWSKASPHPITVHAEINPECPWVACRMAREWWDDGRGSEEAWPNGERARMTRRETFLMVEAQWPFGEESSCSVEKMASAGFYFTPTSDSPDATTCAYCELELDGWEEGDVPREQHRKRRPECAVFTAAATSSPSSSSTSSTATATKPKLKPSTSTSSSTTASVAVAQTPAPKRAKPTVLPPPESSDPLKSAFFDIPPTPSTRGKRKRGPDTDTASQAEELPVVEVSVARRGKKAAAAAATKEDDTVAETPRRGRKGAASAAAKEDGDGTIVETLGRGKKGAAAMLAAAGASVDLGAGVEQVGETPRRGRKAAGAATAVVDGVEVDETPRRGKRGAGAAPATTAKTMRKAAAAALLAKAGLSLDLDGPAPPLALATSGAGKGKGKGKRVPLGEVDPITNTAATTATTATTGAKPAPDHPPLPAFLLHAATHTPTLTVGDALRAYGCAAIREAGRREKERREREVDEEVEGWWSWWEGVKGVEEGMGRFVV
ncbi:BIR-domain-containing protein [Gonapodya prolifera JEL478]|uniref:BIR-domain-containing protein n=1 Tax=Gonapodya prolifera (strain JEL478) TaxID=1344416 RepID=A0A139A7N5_GONPJ|nr:BIR-domain-containing protein [Gonapodya prolifera JEL478]|eukprot:KXS12688.1 BIR-domain-containing protein [Gonapodya prolifera JEL478]